MGPRIDSKESIPSAYLACAGIFKQSMGARNRVVVPEFVPWNRFLGFIKV
jgi:hypothetical protein